jgi:hypothetical protein
VKVCQALSEAMKNAVISPGVYQRFSLVQKKMIVKSL